MIPARLSSQRLPGKPLLKFSDLEMIEHVRRRSSLVLSGNLVAVTSSDDPILAVVREYHGFTHKSLQEHENGLSRVGEFARSVDWTHFIVVQGDEILILPEQIKLLLHFLRLNPLSEFVNVVSPITAESEIEDTSIVKCTVRKDNSVIDIFRKSPLSCPFVDQITVMRKITGLFAISAHALQDYLNAGAGLIEKLESIEQMRLVDLGIEIQTLQSSHNYPSVNIPTDIDKVKFILENDPLQSNLLREIL